jgi:hypothetical protein
VDDFELDVCPRSEEVAPQNRHLGTRDWRELRTWVGCPWTHHVFFLVRTCFTDLPESLFGDHRLALLETDREVQLGCAVVTRAQGDEPAPVPAFEDHLSSGDNVGHLYHPGAVHQTVDHFRRRDVVSRRDGTWHDFGKRRVQDPGR